MTPATLTTILGGVGGLANYFLGKKQKKEGQQLYKDQLEALRSGKFNLGLSGAQTEAANLARQYGEQTARQAGERAAAGQQATLMAARGGDPRMAAGLGSQVAASDQSVRDAQNAALATSVSAQQNLANIQQDLTTQNQLFRQGLEGMEMQRGAAAAEAGRQQQLAGIGQALQSPIMGMQMGAAAELAGFDKARDFFYHGGMITPGQFSHQKNPIHMIDKNGDKVGEATGGEIIFNPEQTETIENLVESGRATQLIQYMRDLLDQPQFQDEEESISKSLEDNFLVRERRKRGYSDQDTDMFIRQLRDKVRQQVDAANKNRNMEDGGMMPKTAKGISIDPAIDAFLNFVMQTKDRNNPQVEEKEKERKGQ
jgi:hypothetical protein